MKKKLIFDTKFWIIIFAALVIVLGALVLLLGNGGDGTVANIYLDGELYESVDLSRVTKPYDIVISTKLGTNTVHVEPGAISVTEADCRDGICVSQGRLTQAGIPIVCLPHRLVIEIAGDEFDA